jgi:uncharacterized membrane protein YoaT (DUF817 family)
MTVHTTAASPLSDELRARARIPVFPLRPADLKTFAWQQTLACIFPGAIFLTLAFSRIVPLPDGVGRYDFILAACLFFQGAMIAAKFETRDELKVIAVFHGIGLALELYKTRMGSWGYPEPAWTKIAGVPLYSGFMYASVASYLCQAWRRLGVELSRWPGLCFTVPLAVLVYANFFTHHFLPDARWILTAAVFAVFWRTRVRYAVRSRAHEMPLALAFALIGFFVYVAENIATFFGAWQYPDQRGAWTLVHVSKISSWFLLVIISFVIVAQLKHVKERLRGVAAG